MAKINLERREAICQIVYYGPAMSGKTTCLQAVHTKCPEEKKTELTSINTTGDRTLYFDYFALDLGQIQGLKTRFSLYTVPGQVSYNQTRKYVLTGVDGVIFVADSQEDKLDENIESLDNLEENLLDMNIKIIDLPLIFQWNKRDLPNILPLETLEEKLNPRGLPSYPTVAETGENVFPALKECTRQVLESIR
jgi:signal recognition particle receptor subunit beta